MFDDLKPKAKKGKKKITESEAYKDTVNAVNHI